MENFQAIVSDLMELFGGAWRWITSLKAIEAAAWVQSIGSIAAIVGAGWVPWKINRDGRALEKKAKQLQARSLAFVFHPLFERAYRKVKELHEAASDGANIKVSYVTFGLLGEISEVNFTEQFDHPDDLLSRASQLHLLGSAAESSQDSLSDLVKLSMALCDLDTRWRYLEGDGIEERTEVDQKLRQALFTTKLAVDALASLIDSSSVSTSRTSNG